MSGTSLDGIDYALCSITRGRIDLVRHWRRNFPAALRDRLHAAAQGRATSHETAQWHHDLGRCYAGQAREGLHGQKVELVGFHGQTIFHRPEARSAATFQLGEPAYLAEAL